MNVYKNKSAQDKILATYDQLIAAWGVPVNQVDIPTRYGTTHVNRCGNSDAPPLVLFHGVGDDSALMWIYNAKALAEKFSIYAIDTIGGPGKSVPGEAYNQEFADEVWIDEILDYFQLVSIPGLFEPPVRTLRATVPVVEPVIR